LRRFRAAYPTKSTAKPTMARATCLLPRMTPTTAVPATSPPSMTHSRSRRPGTSRVSILLADISMAVRRHSCRPSRSPSTTTTAESPEIPLPPGLSPTSTRCRSGTRSTRMICSSAASTWRQVPTGRTLPSFRSS